jgi:ribosomal protein S20
VAKTPRTWTGARTPSGLKRVRQAERRREVLQPRRSAAKTYVAKALAAATQPTDSIDPAAALIEALSALDRAAKAGAIHPNAAARRKSRLTIKVNAAVGGTAQQAGGRIVKTTGKAAAAKAAKARIAAGKAGKAKGAQTAAGKARAALSKTARAEAAAAKAAAVSAAAAGQTETVPAKAAAKAPAKAAAKAPAKATAKSTAKVATRKTAAPAKPAKPAKVTAKTASKAASKPKKAPAKG